jgi:hypothetical protein
MAEAFGMAAAGGAAWGYGWKFPFWFARVAVQDPFFLAFFVAGIVVAFRRWRREGIDLPVTFFGVTTIATVLLFASPGIDSNHLIDLLVAAAVLVAVELSEQRISAVVARRSALVWAAAIAATWIPGAPSVRHFFEERGRPTLENAREIARRLPPEAADSLLAENPLVPLVFGRRPEVLDAFSLRLIAAESEEVRARFLERLARRGYGAVVLTDWSGEPFDRRWAAIEAHGSAGVSRFYGEVHFPSGFLEVLRAHYQLSFVCGTFVVFEPRR